MLRGLFEGVVELNYIGSCFEILRDSETLEIQRTRLFWKQGGVTRNTLNLFG